MSKPYDRGKAYDRGRRDEKADLLAYLGKLAADAAAEVAVHQSIESAIIETHLRRTLVPAVEADKHVGTARLRITDSDMPRHVVEDGACKICERDGVREGTGCPGRPAAIALIRHSDWGGKRLLVVTRKEGGFGLPGGKKENGESMLMALKRELREEINIDVLSADEVYVAPSPRTKRTVYAFLVSEWIGKLQALEPGTSLEWMAPRELITQSKFYGDFYARMFEAVRW